MKSEGDQSCSELAVAVFVLACLLVASELYDWLHIAIASSEKVWLFHLVNPLAIGMLLALGLLASRGRQVGMVSLVAGAILAHTVSVNFRGSWVRLGTFDDFEFGNPPSPLLSIALLLCGYFLDRLYARLNGEFKPISAVAAFRASIVLVAAGLVTWLICSTNRFADWSSFAATRHFFLLPAGFSGSAAVYFFDMR